MNEAKPMTGRCLCGDVRYEFTGAPIGANHCHCESCRRHTGTAMASFVTLRRTDLHFTGAEPIGYVSSPGITRSHCGRCGSPITWQSDRSPDEIDLFIGTLDDPGRFAPTLHIHTAEQVRWLEILDDLPRYARERQNAAPMRVGPRRVFPKLDP
jgi:hypothetical protein